MKYLKKFNEEVIKPSDDIKNILHKICYFMEDITLDKINLEFNPINIEFVDVAKFTEDLKTKSEKAGVPKKAEIMGGIKFAAVNGYKKMIYVCIEPIQFIDAINNRNIMRKMYPLLLEILRHESIHLQQILRAKKDFYSDNKGLPKSLYNLERSPIVNSKDYFSHKTEIMAYAQSFVDECHENGMNDNQILDALKTKKILSWIQKNYSNMDKETKNQFIKNVYLYLKEK